MTQLLPAPGAPARLLPGDLAEQAVHRGQRTLPWLRDMPPGRLEVMMRVTRAGIRSFEGFLREPGSADPMQMFLVAPRELVRSVTLQQTLQLMRITSGLIEGTLANAADREASVVFSRQLAFAAAELYAQVGDGSGLWDRRLEQYVVDAALKGPLSDGLYQRIIAVGWRGHGEAVTAWGSRAAGLDTDRMRRLAWDAGADLLVGDSGENVVVVAAAVAGGVGGVIEGIADAFGPGPVLIGPVVPDVRSAWLSLRAAVAAAEVVAAGSIECIVHADSLLPERALCGDPLAREELIERAYVPLRDSRQPLLATVRHYLEAGGAVEAAARRLGVHPNTVRYRLKRIADATGLDPATARDAFVLQCALRLGLVHDARVASSAG